MLQLNRGILIAIEGIDGSGKSTIANNICNTLYNKGFSTLLTKEPGDSELGVYIRELVQTQKIPITAKAQYLLFAADRAQHFNERVIPALQENKIVISDRLSDSSLAYQGYGNGLDCETIMDINQWSMNNIPIDLTIFVRISVEKAIERCYQRGRLSAYERKDFLQKVADGFEQLYKNRSNSIIIDGTQSPENLTINLCNAIIQWIQSNAILL